FLHRFEQSRLHLGRRAVDLVRKHQVGENRSLLKLELAALVGLQVDFGAGDVGRQQIRRELHARQVGGQMLRERLDRAGLGQSRQAFDQEIPVRQQADQYALDQTVLAEDRLSDTGLELDQGIARWRTLYILGGRDSQQLA